MKTKTTSFKVFAPTKTKDISLNENGTLTITGIASTTNRDLDGDIVTQEAIQSLKEQVVGLNLHLDHTHTYEGGIGAITGATVEDNSLLITAVVLPEYATGIKERLDIGMNFGFSIGGIPEFGMNYDIITDFKLLEVSLTLLPANWDTFGTIEAEGIVKSNCLTGACHHILKNLTGDKMRTKAEETPQGLTEEQVISLINEALAENAQSFIDEIRNELTTIVNEAIDAKLEENKSKEEPVVDEETKAEELPDEENKSGENTVIEEEDKQPKDPTIEETKTEEETVDEETKADETIKPEDVEKMVDKAVDKLFKKLDAHRKTGNSKFNNFVSTRKTKKTRFLDSETRDQFGRNKKYL